MNYRFIPRFYYSISFLKYFSISVRKIKPANLKINNLFSNSILYNVGNARTGLRLLLNSISSGPLRIGIQAYTCETVFLAIQKAGHKAVFIDINHDLTLDKEDLKRKIGEIDVLVVTHTFGYPDDLDEIRIIAGNKIIIEDCAHSFLSIYKGKLTGLFGDAAIFSTGLAKFPPIGAGGFCLINNESKFPLFVAEYSKMEQIGSLASMKTYLKTLALSIMMKPPFYGLVTYRIGKKLYKKLDLTNKHNFPQFLGFKWVTKVFLSGQPYFIRLLKKQKENSKLLYELIDNKYIVPGINKDADPNGFVFPLFIQNRDELYDILLKNNIEPGKHFSRSLEWATEAGYKQGECKKTEEIVKRILTVPCHYGVSKSSIRKIASIINKHAIPAGSSVQ